MAGRNVCPAGSAASGCGAGVKGVDDWPALAGIARELQ
jgi:hypothetical protein